MKRFRKIWPILAAAAILFSCSKDDITVIPDPGKEQEQPGKPGEQPETPPEPEKSLSGTVIYGGAGLDFGKAHIITKISFTVNPGSGGREVLAVFQGANSADWSDAMPLLMIKQPASPGAMVQMEVNCSKGFRYVRYVTADNSGSNLSSMAFFGREGEGDDSNYYQITNLPTVIINTEGGRDVTTRSAYIQSSVYIVSEEGKSFFQAPGTGIKGRGNASWDFPKKPYKLKFAEKRRVLGSPSIDRKWTLINNYGDKTLMRNILAFEVSRRVGMAYTPFSTPVDVLFNGRYMGCYQLCDQVEVGENRVPAKNGYLIEIDAYARGEPRNFYSDKGTPVTVKYPQDDVITDAQMTFIQDYFRKLETAVFALNYTDGAEGYRKYMDLDSFLRNFIAGEFCGNTDTYWSVNMYKDASNGVFYTGPAWDYDLAFDNDNRTFPINNINDYIFVSRGSVASDAVRSMVKRIVKGDSSAKARLVEIWDGVKPALMDLDDYVDETAALLDQSQELNFIRWPILNEYVHQNPRIYGSYSGEVNNVKAYVTRRLTKFDELVRK